MREIIDYDRETKILNTDQLPRGTGCHYLLCILPPYDEPREYIAKRWLRTMPASTKRGEVVIRF